MPKEHYSELLALVAVARERSFTRAAAQLGMSQSMLSHTIRDMEARLGVRLLTRTTRSVSVTHAGERLLTIVAPRLQEVESELRALVELRDVPAGTVRIAAPDHAIDTLLWPRLSPVLIEHGQIQLELRAEPGITDLVQGRFDLGVRLGHELAKDAPAIRIGPDVRFAIVASPDYAARHRLPGAPHDLVEHVCLQRRGSNHAGLPAWTLRKGAREVQVRVEGRLTFGTLEQVRTAALSGHGLAYLPEDMVRAPLDDGRLVPVLKAWWPRASGYHLFHPAQRGISRAMQVVIEALRYPS